MCGNRKALAHYRNIVWDRGEKLYLGVRQPAPEGKELHLLTCAACNVQFYGKPNQQRCDTCGKPRIQSQKSGRSRSKRAIA